MPSSGHKSTSCVEGLVLGCESWWRGARPPGCSEGRRGLSSPRRKHLKISNRFLGTTASRRGSRRKEEALLQVARATPGALQSPGSSSHPSQDLSDFPSKRGRLLPLSAAPRRSVRTSPRRCDHRRHFGEMLGPPVWVLVAGVLLALSPGRAGGAPRAGRRPARARGCADRPEELLEQLYGRLAAGVLGAFHHTLQLGPREQARNASCPAGGRPADRRFRPPTNLRSVSPWAYRRSGFSPEPVLGQGLLHGTARHRCPLTRRLHTLQNWKPLTQMMNCSPGREALRELAHRPATLPTRASGSRCENLRLTSLSSFPPWAPGPALGGRGGEVYQMCAPREVTAVSLQVSGLSSGTETFIRGPCMF
ncbi:interleukin-17D isoform X4 [Camelus ferus]|uniref:Interleukin-17D isoform X4 n=1 Tax=Camelus ferus TaxID=419612 RepID=A0A8B8UCQ5_CAMFR|nr:interleukin-17D isoform X4 [Camelus ferus]